MPVKRLFIPDDMLSSSSRQEKEVRLLQYTNASNTENYDACLTHHALVYILSGIKQIKVSENEFSIRPGELFLIRRGEYTMSEYITGANGFQSILLFFNQKVAIQILDRLNGLLPDLHTEAIKKETKAIKIIPQNKVVTELFRSLETYSKEKSPFLVEIIRLKFMELIYLLLDSPYKNVILTFLQDAARYETPSITAVLEQHLYSPLTIEELAKLSGRSLSGFKREFTQLYGDSPRKWIRKKKLAKASFLLENSSKSIEEVAEECGFVNASHFARLFKESCSNTPSGFRAKQTES